MSIATLGATSKSWAMAWFGIVLSAAPLVSRTAFAGDVVYQLGEAPVDQAVLEAMPVVPLTRAYIPEAIDLSDGLPTPGDQGDIGACVSWATGYAVRSYYARIEQGAAKFDTNNTVSPAHLHNQLTESQGTCRKPEVNIPMALRMLVQNGAQSIAQYPPDTFCKPVGTTGGQFRIKDARIVGLRERRYGAGPNASGMRADSLDRIKLALAAGHPVLLSMLVGKRLMRLAYGETYGGSVHSSGEVGDDKTGGHAMVIAGYDDRRAAFRLMNSWGPSWADGGFGWVSYSTVLSDGRYAAVMDPGFAPKRPAPSRPVSLPPQFAKDIDFECAELGMSDGPDGKSSIRGFVSLQRHKQSIEDVAGKVGTRSEVVLRPWPICESLLTLREPLRAAHRPKVELFGGQRPLKVGEAFAIQVTPPDVPSFLYVLYIEDDGTVVNLAPRRGPIRAQTDPKAGPIMFGDGKDGRATFRVTAPKSVAADGTLRPPGDPERGHEAVIAIAARAPIKELEEQETGDSKIYRVAPKALAQGSGPPDRLLLSALKDIVLRRETADMLPREVSADLLHLKIVD